MQPPFRQTLEELQAAGKLPFRLTQSQMAAIERSLAGQTSDIAGQTVAARLKTIQDALLSLANPQKAQRVTESGTKTVTEGFSQASARQYVTDRFVSDLISKVLNVDFMLDTNLKIVRGAGNFVRMNADPLQVDAFPALALYRDHARAVPRGLKAGPKGSLIEVPDDDWPSRWADAGAECEDSDWLPWEGDAQTGRGVALKSSDIWTHLGDVRDDGIENDFPPYAFNSGFGVYEVPYKEAVELGLLDDGDKPEGAEVDPGNLFAPLLT